MAASERSRPPPRRWPCSMLRAALATLAVERGYVRPEIDRSLDFIIEGGRHAGGRAGDAATPFVANDCDLSPPADCEVRAHLAAHRPEHGGQVDLPAPERADRRAGADGRLRAGASAPRIGVVDRLFSRVGAADDLARGRSTFMVEMVETAAILNQAGERSLVILDEIGRGTATFDGLSIAWAAIEHLHETQPLPRAVRHTFPRADRARAPSCRVCTTPRCASRNGRARWCSCTR